MQLQHVLETCLYVNDLVAAEEFYTQMLGLTFVSRQVGRHVFLRCGQRMLLLFNPHESRKADSDVPPHGAVGAGHVAFAVRERELPQWRARLESQAVTIEKTIEWPGGGRSLYFRDPSGNSLELATPRIWSIDEGTLE